MDPEAVTLIAVPVATEAPDQFAEPFIAEAPGSVDESALPEAPEVIVEHDEAFFLKHFGISMEDAQQPVSRGKHSGTFGQMITDVRCPVGQMLRIAFEEAGDEAVDEKIVLLKLLDPDFSVTVNRRTGEGTKNPQKTADVVENKTSRDSKPTPKKKIIEKLVSSAEAHDQKSQQNIRQAAASQADTSHRQLGVAPKKQKAEVSKSPVDKKTLPIKLKSPLAEPRKPKAKPKLEVSAELPRQELTSKSIAETKLSKVQTFVPETAEPNEAIAQIEPTEAALVTFNLLEPETGGIEEADLAPDLEIDNQAENIYQKDTVEFQPLETELLATELLDSDFQQIKPDAFIDIDQEATESDGFMAELPFLAFELPDDLTKNEPVEAPQTPVLSQQIARFIETIEPIKSEEAIAILEIVLEKIEQMKLPSEDGSEPVDAQAIRQELEIFCARLLVCLEVEPTAGRVSYLLQTLISEAEDRADEPAKENYDQGTHERKQDFKLLMNDWTRWIDYSLTDIIGRYVLLLTAPHAIRDT